MSAPAIRPVNAKVWDLIFVDTKGKKNKKVAVATPSSAVTVKDIDIRDWSFDDRKMLVSKTSLTRVNIFIGDELVTSISKPLLRATSEDTADILQDGSIKLPAHADKAGVLHLVSYLEGVIKTADKPCPLSRNMSMASSLSVCSAAKDLGMNKYTSHIYKKCEAILRTQPPAYEDIDAMLLFKDAHTRLFDIVVENLAVNIWEGNIPDPDVFSAYLAANPILAAAIEAVNEKHEAKLQADKERNDRLAEQKAYRERKDAKAAREAAEWKAKADKEAALERSCQAKMRKSGKDRKFTVEETRHYERRHGRKPPKGC